MFNRVAILGAGSWGLGIAHVTVNAGLSATIWEYDPQEFEILRHQRTIPGKLPDFRLPDSVAVTNSLSRALKDAELVLLAVPAQTLRSVMVELGPLLPPEVGIVNLAKGIEVATLRRMSEIIIELRRDPAAAVATISGPSHAEEVVRDMPTTVVVAGQPDDFVEAVQECFSTPTFRIYKSHDLIGVELGGSLKNIIAISAGIAAGLGLGDNTLGALITRGLAEITRLGVAMGASPETFAGLSGIGDLVTTCASRHSRNRFVGEAIGRGESLQQVLDNMKMVAEGVQTTRSGYQLSRKFQVEMPITRQVHDVLFEGKEPSEAVGDLMVRSLKEEVWQ
jgi:glycerol-3-phosphate dehydrogenase (NAD(P)+)